MRRNVIVLVILLSMVSHVASAQDQSKTSDLKAGDEKKSLNYKWSKNMAAGINQPVIQKIAISSNPQSVWLSTAKAIYQQKSTSEVYQIRLNLPAQVKKVYDLSLANGGETVYVASDQGLYQSIDEGKHWQKIYDSADEVARVSLSVSEIDDDIFLGTRKGLWHRAVDENSWEQLSSIPRNNEINKLIELNGNLYALANNTVYEIDTQTLTSKEIFRQGVVNEVTDSTDVETENEDVENKNNSVIDLAFDPSTQQFILVTSRGVMIASGPKFQWELLVSLPVNATSITSLIEISNTSNSHQPCSGSAKSCLSLLLAAEGGVYIFSDGSWKTINQGLFSPKVNHFDVNKSGNVYAATDYGVYELILTSSSNDQDTLPIRSSTKIFEDDDFLKDPTINEVQSWVIEYAEVSNNKISQWRRLAKKQALLPSVNFGMDGGRDWGRGDSIFGSSSGGGTHYIAPDDKSSGQDIGFDVSLSWDLGDYIWSTDQTTIDSRSKMMVELRETLLTQATQLYFERRRLQIELRDSDDESDIFEKEMRIAEITALLDASTGGKFTEQLSLQAQ